MRHFPSAGACALALALGASPAAHAQITPVSTVSHDSTAVDEVVVTATRSARALVGVPESVSVLGAEAVRDSPADSLDDVLRRVPSVDLPTANAAEEHPTADNVSMRGLGGIRALVLLDGVPLNDAFFGYVQWFRAPLETVDRVEIVRGGGATLWGNYAMGGVINILTRPPQGNAVAGEVAGGSFGSYRADAYAAYAPLDRVHLSLDAAVSHTDGYGQTPVGQRQPVDVPTSFTAHNVSADADVALAPGLTARARVNYHDNFQVLQTRLSTDTQRTWSYSGGVTQALGGGALTLSGFHDDSYFRTDNTDTPAGDAVGSVEFVENRHVTPWNDTGASLVWTQPVGGWLTSYALGGDYHGISGVDSAAIFDDASTRVRTDVGSGEQRFLGGFAQVDLQPVKPLEVLASVRYQTFENYDGYDGSVGGLGRVPDRSYDSTDPRVSLRYAVTDDFAVRGAAYRAFRAPTLDNLYRAFSTAYGIYYSNPLIRPETLDGGEIGIDYQWRRLRSQVTAYTNDVHDLITSRNLAAGELPDGFYYGSRLINAGQARSRGVEAELDWTLGAGFSTTLGYTYADSVITQSPLDPLSVGRQQAYIPRHKAVASLTYVSVHGWRVSLDGRYFSRAYTDSDNTLPVDAHFVLDASAAYPLTRRLETFVQIQNMLDRTYIADNSGYTPAVLGTPFTALVGLRLKLR